MPERLPSPDDQRWEEKAAELELEMLDRLRDHAEKWRSGLIALTALIATVGAVTAPFVGKSLAEGDKAAVGIAALASVVALTVGSMSAMRAAYGLPATIANTGTALREWTNREVATSARCLRVARTSTILGFVALVATAAIGFLRAGPELILISVEPIKGAPVCGSLTASGATVTVTGRDGTVHRFELADIRAIETAEAC